LLNRVILIGNLGRDPESTQSKNGNTVTRMNIATSERQKGADGQWGDHTEWHRVVCFGRTAESCQKYLSKGRRVYVEGKLRTNKWQDKDGRDRYTTEIIAYDVKFLSQKGEHGSSSPSTANHHGYAEEDIPF